jgi:CcmD family protein
MCNKKTILFLSLLLPAALQAQQAEMADVMRSNGKIYVVVAVVAVVFLGIIAYLISLEKKIRQLEKKQNPES